MGQAAGTECNPDDDDDSHIRVNPTERSLCGKQAYGPPDESIDLEHFQGKCSVDNNNGIEWTHAPLTMTVLDKVAGKPSSGTDIQGSSVKYICNIF
ncbi:hypothetical protein evm_001065 [Chilo suppressalis]|nr:hypothetical protein evm_001065 [Chilo suppressalis]